MQLTHQGLQLRPTHLPALDGQGQPLQPLLQLLGSLGQGLGVLGQVGGLALQGLEARQEGPQALIHLGSALGQGAAAIGRLTGSLGQILGPYLQLLHALGEGLGGLLELAQPVFQLLGAVVEGSAALRHLGYPRQILAQALAQPLGAVHKGEGALGQLTQIVCEGLGSLGEGVCPVFQLPAAVGGLGHALPDLTDLLQHGGGVGAGHFLPHPQLHLLHGALTELGGDVVGAGVGLVLQFHGLGVGLGDGGGPLGEVLRDGDDHVVGAVRQPLLSLLLAHEVEVQSRLLLQVVHQGLPNVIGLVLHRHRLVQIYHRHRQMLHVPVGVPHGAQKQGGVDGGNGDNGHHHHQQQRIAEQTLPFLSFQRQTLPSRLCRHSVYYTSQYCDFLQEALYWRGSDNTTDNWSAFCGLMDRVTIECPLFKKDLQDRRGLGWSGNQTDGCGAPGRSCARGWPG